jgi:hypothetical protein
MGGAMAVEPGSANGSARAGAQGAGGGGLLRVLNATSRQGPHSASGNAVIDAPAVLAPTIVQAQNPASNLPVPSVETQTDPLASGGRTRISCSNAISFVCKLRVLMGHRFSRNASGAVKP